MKTKVRGIMLAILLSLAMGFTMMPMLGTPAYADEPATNPPAINLGSDILKVGSNTSGAATVHMAGNTWRVIGYGVGTQEKPQVASSSGTMTLIASDCLGTAVRFNPSDYPKNYYKYSNLYNEVQNLTGTNDIFTAGEKAGIVARDLDNIAGDEVTDALLWPLSTQEAEGMNEELRGRVDDWWLRSPSVNESWATCVRVDGVINYFRTIVYESLGLRPAFNYDLGSVILTSAAVGGKPSGIIPSGALEPVGTNPGNEWKLTVKGGHDDFRVDSVSNCDGKTVNIKYSGAVAASGEYISAIITDEDGAVKYYGNPVWFADNDSTSGTAKVSIDGKMETTDKLYVFNERLNGDNKTDYSSALIKINIPAATGHYYGAASKVTKKATEKQAGVRTYTCTVCKATKTETISKLKPSVSGNPTGKMTAKGKNSLVIGWNKIQGVAGYDIFFEECNHNGIATRCKLVKTIKGKKTFSWTKTGLKKNTAYKAYVKAYVMKNGKKSYVRTTPMMHAYTGGQTKNYTNARSVTVNRTNVTLNKGKTFKIKASVVKVNKNKKLMPKKHAPTIRYMTSNKKIATVNSSGRITAKGKGSCYIFAYAHNGVFRQIKVTVK